MALEDNCSLGGLAGGALQVTGQSVAGLQKPPDLRRYFASVADLRRK